MEEENTYFTDPDNPDTDADGLSDYEEIFTYLTLPLDPDSDSDGLDDYIEAVTVACLMANTADTDNDGLIDGTSLGEDQNNDGFVQTWETDPCDPDSEDDGMPDGWEVQFNLDPLVDDSGDDPDGDGLTNLEEYQQGRNPQVPAENPLSSCSAMILYTNTIVTINFVNDDPYATVALWAQYNEQAFEDTGLSQGATAGTFDYTPAYLDGWYRFYTIAGISPQCTEDPPATHDAEVGYDTVYPVSFCDVDPYVSGTSVEVYWEAYDTFSGVDEVELFYRKDGGGGFATTGLIGAGPLGNFSFDPTAYGGDGTYEFFTIAADLAANYEPMKMFTNITTVVDSTPTSGFTVADGVDIIDDDYWTYTDQLSATWADAVDPESGIDHYEYAVGTSPGGNDIKGWTNNYGSTSMTAFALSLVNGQTVYTTVRAYNGAGLYTEVSSDGVEVDTLAPEIAFSFPADSEHLAGSTPEITINFEDDGSGIDRLTFTYLLDFNTVDPSNYSVCFGTTIYQGSTEQGDATCGDELVLTHHQAAPLSEGSHVITVSLADNLANSMTQSLVFYIEDPESLIISPTLVTLDPGEQVTFSASGGQVDLGNYQWSASGGSLDVSAGPGVVYTAGNIAGIYAVSVTDDLGASKSAAVKIRGVIEISPPLANLARNDTQVFSVVEGSSAVQPYTWTQSGGTLDINTGLNVTYTAGTALGSYNVTVLDSASPPHSFMALVNITEDVGRAIIVAGGGPQADYWDRNENMAKRAFQTLITRGFTSDKIYFLSNDYLEQWSGDFDDVSDIQPVIPSEAALLDAFSIWTPEVGPNVPLFVYLIDHGGDDIFNLTANSGEVPEYDQRYLTATELDSMLDDIQSAANCEVIVLYEACYSGSFLPDLANGANPDRILITSTSATSPAYLAPEPVFSLYFLSAIQSGYDLNDSFSDARKALKDGQFLKSKNRGQHPQADGNGDGSFDIKYLASEGLNGVYIGMELGALSAYPVIVGQSPDQNLSSAAMETGATIWAAVDSLENIAEVYGLIIPPGYELPTPDPGGTVAQSPSVDYVKVSFTNTQTNVWEGRYENFVLNGIYTIVIYAKDTRDLLSMPVSTVVTSAQPYIVGEYPARDSWGQATNVQMQFHIMDAEGGIDDTSIQMLVNGVDVTGGCSIIGAPDDYLIEWTPNPVFNALDSVTVEIYAEDFFGNQLVHLEGDTLVSGDILYFTVTDGIDGGTPDGMPDDWEAYFEVDLPDDDADIDGASNLIEFQL